MYSQKLAAVIKANGKVLRELDDTVFIPFGSEYVISLKNLNSVRALVSIQVDGQNVTDGVSLIVEPNKSIEIERFIRNGNLTSGNKLKFIERTQKIEDGPRGIQAEDGLIRVEFEFEKMPAKIINEIKEEIVKRTYVDEYWHRTYPRWPEVWCSTGVLRGMTGNLQNSVTSKTPDDGMVGAAAASYDPTAAQEDFYFSQSTSVQPKAVTGITVPGSISEQKFTVGAWFPTDGQKHVMVLKIMGKIGETVVEAPVTVKTKVECPTCGTQNKFGAKFCQECGTSLIVL